VKDGEILQESIFSSYPKVTRQTWLCTSINHYWCVAIYSAFGGSFLISDVS